MIHKLRTGLIHLCLIPCLLGCVRVEYVPQIEFVKLSPPAALVELVPIPSFDRVKTNADLLNYVLSLRDALDAANIKLKAIKEWASQQ